MTATDDVDWLTTKQFAALIQVHPKTVSRWVSEDPDMVVKRIGPTGRFLRIHRSELDRRRPVSPIGDTDPAQA